MKRIVIIGTTGSGKTTLGKRLGEILNLKVFDLDEIYWLDNWELASDELAEQRLSSVVVGDEWIISGNYSRSRHLTWNKADTIIWLDYPFWIKFIRLLKRSVGRAMSQETMWGTNNRESWGRIFSKDSILRWLWKSHKPFKERTPKFLADYPHLTVIHHPHPRNTERFLDELAGG
jgi:adenylate kinase family enzyme